MMTKWCHDTRATRRAAACALTLLLAACGGSRPGLPLQELQPLPESTVRPGDAVVIEFWQQIELSGERIVDRDGFIHVPLVDSVHVADLTAVEIRDKLVGLYRQFYSEPLILVHVRLGVSLTGEVRDPGRYAVDPAFNLLDAIGQAGGLLYEANREKIELTRAGQRYIINLDDAQLAATPEQLRLQSGDWVYVPRRFWTLQRTLAYATIASITLAIITLLSN
jgi:protein involved in polysaccharide export with SLBB domain